MTKFYPSEFESTKTRFHDRFRILTPWTAELIAMKHGLRSAILVHIPPGDNFENDFSWVQALCSREGFYYVAKETPPRGMDVLISNTRLAPDRITDVAAQGEYFGYPKCCVDNYLVMSSQLRFNPFINDIGDLLGTHDNFDFRMNVFLQGSPFHLFKHFPCSLRCEATLSFAGQLLDAIEREDPELHACILRFNKAPVLYTDICGTAVLFRGKMEGDCIRYDEFYTDINLSDILQLSRRNTPEDASLFDDIRDALSSANEVVLSGDALTIGGDPLRHRSRTFKSGRLFWKLLSFH